MLVSGMSRQVTHMEVTRLAGSIRLQWKNVARCLLPRPFTEEMLADFEKQRSENLYEQAVLMLEKWRQKYGPEATVKSLCQALLRAKCRRSAEMVFSEAVVQWIIGNTTHSYARGNSDSSVKQEVLLNLCFQ